MFSYYKNGISDVVPNSEISIDVFKFFITQNPEKEKIQKLHAMDYKSEEYAGLKITLPYITPHGTFAGGRSDKNIKQFSNYLYFDIDAPSINISVEEYKKQLIEGYGSSIALLSKSVGGRGVFFLVKVNGLTKDVFSKVQQHFIHHVFSKLPIDKKAAGLSRATLIPYDEDVYVNDKAIAYDTRMIEEYTINDSSSKFNHTKTSTMKYLSFINTDISNDVKNIDDRIDDNEKYNSKNDNGNKQYIKENIERCYSMNVTYSSNNIKFYNIDYILRHLIFETKVDVVNPVYDVRPVEYVKTWFRPIPDGKKHTVFTTMMNTLMFLNPDADLLLLQSYISYINRNYTCNKPMKLQELLRTTEYVFNRTKMDGVLLTKERKKNIHFNKKCGLSGDAKRDLAAKVNGGLRRENSMKKIQKAIDELKGEGRIVNKKNIAERTGLCKMTIDRHWRKELNAANTSNKGV